MPNLLIGGQKILGGITSQLTFLCSSNKKIGAKLFPPESQQSISKHLSYFERQMRPCTQNLIQALMLDHKNKREQQAHRDQQWDATLTEQEQKHQQYIDKQKSVFFRELLHSLNDELTKQTYFGARSVSLADIQYYCEISTVVLLLKAEVNKQDLPRLAQWFYQDMQETHPDLV